MKRAETKNQLAERFRNAAEKLSNEMSEAYENEIRHFLTFCEETLPGHKFTAQQAHGSLYVKCEPAIAGKNDISQWSAIDEDDDTRIASIVEEFDDLKDWSMEMETGASVSIFDISGSVESFKSQKEY